MKMFSYSLKTRVWFQLCAGPSRGPEDTDAERMCLQAAALTVWGKNSHMSQDDGSVVTALPRLTRMVLSQRMKFLLFWKAEECRGREQERGPGRPGVWVARRPMAWWAHGETAYQ